MAIVPLFFLLAVGVVESFRSVPEVSTDFVVGRMNTAFVSMGELSVVGIVARVLIGALLLDVVGYNLQLRCHESRVGNGFDEATRLADQLAKVHVQHHALRLSDPWFTTAANSVKALASSASACQESFSEALAEWQDSIRVCRIQAARGPHERLAIRSTDPLAEASDPMRDRQRGKAGRNIGSSVVEGLRHEYGWAGA